MTINRTLTHTEARTFYNRLGRRQDWQSFYEGLAVEMLLTEGRFEQAARVFEFGCGTGALARTLLNAHLPVTAEYVGVDVSQTMIGLTKARLDPFGDRVQVILTDGALAFPHPDGSFDRFISTYVLDLLSERDIERVLDEAYRLLSRDGLLCLISLTHGLTPLSRLIEKGWLAVHRWNPVRVGGCRPLQLSPFLTPQRWKVTLDQQLTSYGLASEILIARRL